MKKDLEIDVFEENDNNADERTGWIHISEAIPGAGPEILVCTEEGIIFITELIGMTDHEPEWAYDDLDLKVEYWQYLPEPPTFTK